MPIQANLPDLTELAPGIPGRAAKYAPHPRVSRGQRSPVQGVGLRTDKNEVAVQQFPAPILLLTLQHAKSDTTKDTICMASDKDHSLKKSGGTESVIIPWLVP